MRSCMKQDGYTQMLPMKLMKQPKILALFTRQEHWSKCSKIAVTWVPFCIFACSCLFAAAKTHYGRKGMRVISISYSVSLLGWLV